MLSSFAESAIFFQIGCNVVLLAESDSRSGHVNGGLIGFAIRGALVGRAANIIPLAALANCWRQGGRCAGRRAPPRISWQWQLQMWHAGLRGAIAYAISLEFPGPLQPVLLNCTSVLVLVMVAVMGSTTAPLLGVLGIPFGKKAAAAATAVNAIDLVNDEPPAGRLNLIPCSRYTRFCSDVCGFVHAATIAIDQVIAGSPDHSSIVSQLGLYCVRYVVLPVSNVFSRAARRFGTCMRLSRVAVSVLTPAGADPRIELDSQCIFAPPISGHPVYVSKVASVAQALDLRDDSERAAIQVKSSADSIGGIVGADVCDQDTTDVASGATLASILSGPASRVDVLEIPIAGNAPEMSEQGLSAHSLSKAELHTPPVSRDSCEPAEFLAIPPLP